MKSTCLESQMQDLFAKSKPVHGKKKEGAKPTLNLNNKFDDADEERTLTKTASECFKELEEKDQQDLETIDRITNAFTNLHST